MKFMLEAWFCQHYAQGMLPAAAVSQYREQVGLSIEQLLLSLLPLARRYAHPIVSNFAVGAVALGYSGAIYIGANQEFKHQPLHCTLHAEQLAVLNAREHQETAITLLAVDHPPCGFCRQFLLEADVSQGNMIILYANQYASLAELLPSAFSMKALQLGTNFWHPPRSVLHWVSASAEDELANAALQAAQRSYVPYSNTYCGVAIRLPAGLALPASAVENVAFNPSILALSLAFGLMRLRGLDYAAMEQVCLVQPVDAMIDQLPATMSLLMAVAPRALFYSRLCQNW